MAAIGTRVEVHYRVDRGFKVWEYKFVMTTGTAGTVKQSQDLGVNGNLHAISIKAPALVTDTQFTFTLHRADGTLILTKLLSDNGQRNIHPIDGLQEGDSDAGAGIPVFNDDYFKLTFATAQAGGALDFETHIRGTE